MICNNCPKTYYECIWKKFQKAFFWKNLNLTPCLTGSQQPPNPQFQQERNTVVSFILIKSFSRLVPVVTGWRLKKVDIPNKIIAHEYSRIRRLSDNFFSGMEVDPAIFKKTFGTSIKFHWNLLFKSNKVFHIFLLGNILSWKKHLAMMTEITSCILSHYI